MARGPKTPAAPVVSFQGRISVEADKLRRKLESRLNISACKLIERALLALDREVSAMGPAE